MPGNLFRVSSAADPKSRHLVPWQKGDWRDGQNLIIADKKMHRLEWNSLQLCLIIPIILQWAVLPRWQTQPQSTAE